MSLSALGYIVLSVGYLIVASVEAQSGCERAPTSTLREVCEEKGRMHAMASKNVEPLYPEPPAPAGEEDGWAACGPVTALAWIRELGIDLPTWSDCDNIGCICYHFRHNHTSHCINSARCAMKNGRVLKKGLRKEYRMLSDIERERFHSALSDVKSSGKFDELVEQHRQVATTGGAHAGPGFLGWHRHYIHMLEIELRIEDPDVSLPYWDSTLDSNIPNPADSVLWSEELMGGTDSKGYITGPFSNWKTANGQYLTRNLGADRSSRLFQTSDITFLMRQTGFESFFAFTAPQCVNFDALEYRHDNIHKYVGGHMGEPTVSANDPIFFLHHAFTDFIWELWRQQRQTRAEREDAYPAENTRCATWHHWRSGHRENHYIDNFYDYSARPTCSQQQPTCGSRFLFCDRSHGPWRCASKVRLGGNCAGFRDGEDVCYDSQCRCQNSQGGQWACRCVAVLNENQQPESSSLFNDQTDGSARMRILAFIGATTTLEQAYRRLMSTNDRNEQNTIWTYMQSIMNQLPSADEMRELPDNYPMLIPYMNRLGVVMDGVTRILPNR